MKKIKAKKELAEELVKEEKVEEVVETLVVVEEKPVVVKQVSSKPVSNYKKLEAFNKRMR